MGCNAALYLILHESLDQRGRDGLGARAGLGCQVGVLLEPMLLCLAGGGGGVVEGWKGRGNVSEGAGQSGGQAAIQEPSEARGSWEGWSATLRSAQAAINLKSLGILLAFSKYY